MEQSHLQSVQVIAGEIAARAAEADRMRRLPAEDIDALRSAGIFAMSVPRSHGGAGASLALCAEVVLELAQANASAAIVAAMPIQIFGHRRETGGWPEPIFAGLCKAAVEEGAIINAAGSEPILGSPSRGGTYATTARLDDDTVVIDGHKTWITGGQHLTHLLVRAGLEEQIADIVVPSGCEGIVWEDTWQEALSLRASESHDAYFNGVRVSSENIIPQRREPAPYPNAWFPVLIAAVYLGAAIAARDAVISFALERTPTALGKPIATLPKIQRQIGEIDIALQAARTFLGSTAKAWDGDEAQRPGLYAKVVAAKYFAIQTANEATQAALVIAGGQALTPGLPIERSFRDVRAGLMQPPAGDTALEIVGRAALGPLSDQPPDA